MLVQRRPLFSVAAADVNDPTTGWVVAVALGSEHAGSVVDVVLPHQFCTVACVSVVRVVLRRRPVEVGGKEEVVAVLVRGGSHSNARDDKHRATHWVPGEKASDSAGEWSEKGSWRVQQPQIEFPNWVHWNDEIPILGGV